MGPWSYQRAQRRGTWHQRGSRSAGAISPGYGIVLDDAALRRYEVTGKVTDVVPARP